MKKYINAKQLIEEINERLAFYLGTAYSLKDTNAIDGLNEALEIIESLQQEQPKVDVEKEYKKWWDSIKSKINIEHVMEWYMHETARHFAEWGATHLNARKEE